MRVGRLRLVLAWLALPLASAPAADLSNIVRTIAKQPVYKSQPKYCLLVFGPEAKTRIWLVLDGDTLYVDRNGNGDLTEQGEQVTITNSRILVGNPLYDGYRLGFSYFEAGHVSDADGKTKHENLNIIHLTQDRSRLYVGVWVGGKGSQRARDLQFSDHAKDAPVTHFGGPLSLIPEQGLVLVRGDEARSKLSAFVGTPGLGKGVFAVVPPDRVPANTYPDAQIDFQNKDPRGKPVRVRVSLKHG